MNALAPPSDARFCRYGASRLLFRGPARRLDGTHVAALGGSATYGRGAARPWPDMAEEALGVPVANLGYPAAGLDLFLSEPDLLAAATGARATVIEALDAPCLSNRFYTVHGRRNDRFLTPSRLLRTMCPDVDWTRVTFVRHMLSAIEAAHPEAMEPLRDELRAAWTARMRRLIEASGGPVVLLWLGARDPRDAIARDRLDGAPLFVDAAMLQGLRGSVEAVVTHVDPALEAGDGRAQVRAARAVTEALEGLL